MTEQTEQSGWAGRPPKVAVVTLNWNGWRDTTECLESLESSDYPNYRVIVVDNGSRDDSIARIREWAARGLGTEALKGASPGNRCAQNADAPKVRLRSCEAALWQLAGPSDRVLLSVGGNLGFTGGNNAAIEYALQDPEIQFIFLLNNDALVDAHCVSSLIDLDREVDAGIVGAVVIDNVSGQLQYASRGSPLRLFFSPLLAPELRLCTVRGDFWTSHWFAGTGVLIRADVLRAVHSMRGCYLSTELFMDFDEFEFCHTARLAGFRSVVTNRAVVRHNQKRPGAPGGRLSALRYYYATRNRILLASRILPFHWKGLFHVFNLTTCAGRACRNILAQRPERAQAIIAGFLDGYRGVTGKWSQHPQ